MVLMVTLGPILLTYLPITPPRTRPSLLHTERPEEQPLIGQEQGESEFCTCPQLAEQRGLVPRGSAMFL